MNDYEELMLMRSACDQSNRTHDTIEVYDGETLLAKWREGKRVYHNVHTKPEKRPEWALEGYGRCMSDTATD